MGSPSLVVRIMVLLSLTIMMPSTLLAQQSSPCWEKLLPCLENAKATNYNPTEVDKCCPDITDVVLTQLPCFCTAMGDLVSQGAEAAAIFNGILGTCQIKGTMQSLCNGKSPPASSGTPSTPTGTPSTPTGTPSTPTGTPSTPSGTPSTTSPSTSSNSASFKIATKSITGLFVILMPLMMC